MRMYRSIIGNRAWGGSWCTCLTVDLVPFISGWAGSGLGAKHQGIEEPIKAAEARSNIDKYKVRWTCGCMMCSVLCSAENFIIFDL